MIVDLYVIEDNSNPGRFLIATRRGKPVFGSLDVANTFSSMTAVKNQVARMTQSPWDVAFRRARLEVLPK